MNIYLFTKRYFHKFNLNFIFILRTVCVIIFATFFNFQIHSQSSVGLGLPVWPVVTGDVNSWFNSSTATSPVNFLDWRTPSPTGQAVNPGTAFSRIAATSQACVDGCGDTQYYIVHNGKTTTAQGPKLNVFTATGQPVTLSNGTMLASTGDNEIQCVRRPGYNDQWFIIYTQHVDNASNSGGTIYNPGYMAANLQYALLQISGVTGTFITDGGGIIVNRSLKMGVTAYKYAHGKATTPFKVNAGSTGGGYHHLYAQRRNNNSNSFIVDRYVIDGSTQITGQSSTNSISSTWWGNDWFNPIVMSSVEISPDGTVALNMRNDIDNAATLYLFKNIEAAANISTVVAEAVLYHELALVPDPTHAGSPIPYNVANPLNYLSIDNVAFGGYKDASGNSLGFLRNLEKRISDIEFSPNGQYIYFAGGGVISTGWNHALSYLGQIDLTAKNAAGHYLVRLQTQTTDDGLFNYTTGMGSLATNYNTSAPNSASGIHIKNWHTIVQIESSYDGNLYFTKYNEQRYLALPDPDMAMPIDMDPHNIDMSTPGHPNISTVGLALYMPDQIDWYKYSSVSSVCCTDSVKIINAGPYCTSDAPDTLKLKSGSTPGGTWVGSGVDAVTGVFTPFGLATGTYNIKYITPNCLYRDSIDIAIVNSVVLNITSAKTSYCKNSPVDTIEVSPVGGVFWTKSGLGITDPNSGYFDPSLCNVGTDTIFYGKAGQCGDTVQLGITINALDVASLPVTYGPFCESSLTEQLTPNPGSSAGTWSASCGACITSSGDFKPATATPGKYKITYTTLGQCPVAVSDSAIVNPKMIVDITTPSVTKCNNAAFFNITLSGTSSAGGIWTSLPSGKVDNTGKFNPLSVNSGAYKVYYIAAGTPLSCSAVDSLDITITPMDTAKITLGQGPFCVNDPIQILKKETVSSNGTWSGTGVTNGATGAFTPSLAGVGSHKITYTTNGTCLVNDTLSIAVVNQMIADITTTNNTNLCADNGLYQIVVSNSTTPGGTWSSIPVGLVSNTGLFNPQGSGGTYKIYYSVAGSTANCMAKDSVLMIVLAREEAQITDGTSLNLCSSSAPKTLTPLNAGGVWFGTGVNASGVFDPAVAGVGGPYVIRYKINGAIGLCPDEDTILITVGTAMNASISAAGPFCENLGKQQLTPVLAGGTFSGVGVNSSGLFDPNAAGAGSHWIKYKQNGQCPSTDSVQIKVEPLPNVLITSDVTSGCLPLTVNFKDISTSAAQSATWIFGDGTSAPLLVSPANTSHTYDKAGTFSASLKLQFQNGCEGVAEKKITVKGRPTAAFETNDSPISSLYPEVHCYNHSKGASSYFWNFPRVDPDSSTAKNPVAMFDKYQSGDSVEIMLVAFNKECSDTTYRWVYFKEFHLFIANAFTPNGDGVNDLFFPTGFNLDADHYEFLIFNRWGENIFTSTTLLEGWNGRKNNVMQEAQIDTYVWKLSYRDTFTGRDEVKIGKVSLIR